MPSSKDDSEFGLFMDADDILPLYDVWAGSNYNTHSVFGCAYIDLPPYVAADLRSLMHRAAQIEARKR